MYVATNVTKFADIYRKSRSYLGCYNLYYSNNKSKQST